MSLATRCTHCGTSFRVVEDQLKVSEGWVRCGRCEQVFNALPELFDLDGNRVSAPDAAPQPPQADAAPSEWPSTLPDDLPPQNSPAEVAPAAQYAGPRVGPQPAPPKTRSWLAPVPATTDFDLDTQVPAPAPEPEVEPEPAPAPITPGVDDLVLDTEVDLGPARHTDTPGSDLNLSLHAHLGQPDAPLAPRPPAETSPSWADEAPAWSPSLVEPDLPPEGADELDSLLQPSARRNRPAARRPSDDRDFRDAEIPEDWLEDAAELAPPPEPPQGFGDHGQGRAEVASPAWAPDPVPQRVEDAPNAEPPSTLPSRFLDDAPTAPGASPSPQTDVAAPLATPLAPTSTGLTPATSGDTPGFVQTAQARARWRHPAVRVALATLAMLLTLALAGQLTYQFRDLIAAHHPPARPWLAQGCELLGCDIKPPLRLEDLQVDSLTFVRASSEGPDTYRLTMVLHNQGPIDLAWPDVDLSLTDTNGAVVLRKVFSVKDASWQDGNEPQPNIQGVPPSAAPARHSTTLQWRVRIAQLQPAGYTADIFYP